LRNISPILLALLCGLATAQEAPPTAPASARGDDVARIVGGIISFTQWPGALAGKIRLCITTPAAHADALVRSMSSTEQLAGVQYLAPEDTHLDTGCDVIYIEQVNDADRANLFQRLAGRPVLSIAGSASGCLMGSLFCLSDNGQPTTFSVNLDTISRSGLRISPKVLFLAHPKPAK